MDVCLMLVSLQLEKTPASAAHFARAGTSLGEIASDGYDVMYIIDMSTISREVYVNMNLNSFFNESRYLQQKLIRVNFFFTMHIQDHDIHL